MWKKIRGYEEYYHISDDGLVRSVKTRPGTHGGLLKQTNLKGYRRVDVCIGQRKSTKLVHRLVAEHFIPNPNNLPYVNHIDGNKANNHMINLEWCSHQENMNHAWRTGLMAKVGKYVPKI